MTHAKSYHGDQLHEPKRLRSHSFAIWHQRTLALQYAFNNLAALQLLCVPGTHAWVLDSLHNS